MKKPADSPQKFPNEDPNTSENICTTPRESLVEASRGDSDDAEDADFEFQKQLFEKVEEIVREIMSGEEPTKEFVEDIETNCFNIDAGRRIFAYLLHEFVVRLLG